MNWTIEYIPERNFIKVVTEGVFNINDYLQMCEDILSQDFWQTDMNVLKDHRKVSFTNTNIETVNRAAINYERNDTRIGCGKAAILVKSTADFGRGRQFELLTNEKVCSNIRIFTDEEQAIKWLTESF